MVATEQHEEHNDPRTPVLEAPRSSVSEILPEQEAEIQRRILYPEAFENVLPSREMNASQSPGFGATPGRPIAAALNFSKASSTNGWNSVSFRVRSSSSQNTWPAVRGSSSVAIQSGSCRRFLHPSL